MIFAMEKKPFDKIAVYEDAGNFVTYHQLCEGVTWFEEKIKGRSLIFCLCQNRVGSLIGYLGGVGGGHVVIMLDSEIDTSMLESLFDSYHPDYLWVPSGKTEQLNAFSYKIISMAFGYSLLLTNCKSCDMHKDLSLLLTTSGSIGNPKLVRISKKNIEANAASIANYLKLSKWERPITTLPMQYSYGLSVINSHLLAGATILMTEKSVVQQEFWDFFSEREATSFAGVPYTYEMLRRMRITEKKLPSVTSMTQAGGKMPELLQKEFGLWAKSQGIRFYIMYGQTEATARMSYLPYEKCLEKIGSIGIPIPGGRFFIRDEKGNRVEEPGADGELVYEGKNVALGYAQTKEDFNRGDDWKGVLETGDIARRDEDGYYYIVGRKKRFIKLYGVRVGLDECEQLLQKQYEGREFACTGKDDHLAVYTNDRIIPEAVCEALAIMLRLSKRAFSCDYIEEIPRNAAGKIQYGLLEEK
ncbi:MAG: AMP-binding protein [Lachnospiraceae bacterium]